MIKSIIKKLFFISIIFFSSCYSINLKIKASESVKGCLNNIYISVMQNNKLISAHDLGLNKWELAFLNLKQGDIKLVIFYFPKEGCYSNKDKALKNLLQYQFFDDHIIYIYYFILDTGTDIKIDCIKTKYKNKNVVFLNCQKMYSGKEKEKDK